MATVDRVRATTLQDLAAVLQEADGFGDVAAALARDVAAALARGDSATIDGAWGSSRALTAAALAAAARGPLLIVLPRISDVDDFALDLAGFLGRDPLVFPAWETLPDEHSVSDAVFGGRLRVLAEVEESGSQESEDGPGGETARAPRERARASDGRGASRSTLNLQPSTLSSPQSAICNRRFPVVVTSLPALLQPVPSREERRRGTRIIRVGDELDLEEFLRWLVERGFQRAPAIEAPGEFSVHGGILDIFPPDAVDPLRIELFGDEIESIRRFDAETQRKLEDLREARLTVVGVGGKESGVRSQESGENAGSETASSLGGSGRAIDGRGSSRSTLNPQPATLSNPQSAIRNPQSDESLLDSLPSSAWIVLSELQELRDEGKQYLGRLDQPRGLFSVPSVLERCTTFPTVVVAALAADAYEQSCHLAIESIERLACPRSEVLNELPSLIGNEELLLVACHNEGEKRRLEELFATAPAPIGRGVEFSVGYLDRGFRLVRDRIVVISDHELFSRTEVRRVAPKKRQAESRAIDSFLELHEDDLVVHLSHGIGRYRGMQLKSDGGQAEENLVIEFRDGVRVFVPVSLIHLVQKYVGATKASPELSKLGGTSWAKKKSQVATAVSDLAADMIRMQAARAARPGFSCPPDSQWMRDFEDAFPYTETPDQLHAIGDVKRDMEESRPMDRLICGDVGYGKTEVALRAAFKAIDAGRQVAVLVPTTVLAEQHFRTFSERMAEFPITVEVLSRFRTKGEQKQILERMESGEVDLVVGTHRIVQKDVRFKDLGLVIIDEEQRFGVEAKEMLKQLRLEVDVLTLTATPIPRTLHLSILGIRDISNLTTAPQDRQAIETRLSRFDPHLIRNAIGRELNRGGQVYFVHNRVHDIHEVADRVRQIVPEARVVIGHGQMSADELEDAMFQFVTHRADILVATTIIESGLDIPNANTMFIHRADIYGLADLHQLRGRVGRYKHRAYCYLLLEEGRVVTPQAARRLKAIEEFSELGAGFRIAMRDLEIRGAGNILGTEQSGHIGAVGYELYCQLLENAVRKLKHEPLREFRHVQVILPLSAYFPGTWIPPGRHKIEAYRRMSACGTPGDLADFKAELIDRFGPIPVEAERLLDLRELQLLAGGWQIAEIRLEPGFVVMGYRDPRRVRQLAELLRGRLRVVDQRSAYFIAESPLDDGDRLLAELKSVLQPT